MPSALDMPMRIHTGCEWVETGVKDIFDATVKGRTPARDNTQKFGR